MKKILLSLALVVGLVVTSFAQGLEVASYDNVTEVNSTKGKDYKAYATITNNNSSAVLVKCKRVLFSQTSCAFDSSYFCWDLCYPAGTSNSLGGWTLNPGETSDPSYFQAHVYSKTDGATCIDSIRYVFFVDGNENDSVAIDFKWSAAPNVSVEENKATVANAYPNPASQMFFVELASNPKPNTTIEVFNLLGSKVKSIQVNGLKTEINVSNLEAGVYLYTINVDGSAVETKKFVVKK